MTGLQILGLGHALPKKAVTNDDLANLVDTSDEWIKSRTGIRERRFASKGETTTTLAVQAAKNAMQKAGVCAKDISVCIAATFTPDVQMPSVACSVAQQLCLENVSVAFDLNAACTGFVHAVASAHAILSAQGGRCALIIGSETISRVLDMTDRSTCVLFGDGAGAAVVALSDAHPYCFCGSVTPDTQSLHCRENNLGIEMDGANVYRFATLTVPEILRRIMQKSEKSLDEIDYFVCHQANSRIIEQIARRLGAHSEKFYLNLQRYGNTSAASIPIALSEMSHHGLLPQGTTIICAGFGAGLTCAGALLTF